MKTSHIRRLLAVAATAVVGLAAAAPAGAVSNPGAYTTRGAWKFISARGLHPPKLHTKGRVQARKLARGDFLLASFPNEGASGVLIGQGGPLIVNRRLQPVWFHPVGTKVAAANLQQETYRGHPVLVWWQGNVTAKGFTIIGQVVVVNRHYRRVATLRAKRPWTISLHDAVISGSDIWVTVYRYVSGQNLTPYGGHRHGTVYDAGVQEYDLRTGELLKTWDALNPGGKPNVPLADSEQAPPPSGPWDAYHVNSIQVLPGNQILVSMRNTWAAYLIDAGTGQILWSLGGKHSSFTFGKGATFAWQHDVQMISGDEVTLFDDDCCRIKPNGFTAAPNGPSRGMVLKLDPVGHTASLVHAYRHSPDLHPAFLGSMQLLLNHNALVDWGSIPFAGGAFSEHTGSGSQVLDVRLPGKDTTYRALFTAAWVGTPYYPPRGAARRHGSRTTIYASWNGATQVARWLVLGGSSPAHLKVIASKAKTGFETAVKVATGSRRVFKVRALSASGKVLRTSPAFR